MNDSFQLRRVFSYLIIFAIALAFVLTWGPGSKGCDVRRSPTENAATVNGKNIPTDELSQNYAQQLMMMKARLGAQAHDAPEAAAHGHHPSSTVGSLPVSGESRLPGEIVTLLQVVVDEVLQQKLVHARQVRVAGYAPHVVRKEPEGPLTRLNQYDRRRAHSERSLS